MYCSPKIIRVIKLRITKWVANVAFMGIGEVFTGFWFGNLRGRDHLGDQGADGKIILRRIFMKLYVGLWI